MTNKLVLKSDFHDYYDHWFDRVYYPEEEYITFERYSRSGMNRQEMLEYLELNGYNVPKHGLVKDLSLQKDQKVVVYLDINSHRGMDKILSSFGESLKFYPMNYCMEYKKVNDNNLGHSFRALRIGDLNFSLFYKSQDSWMSNQGNVNISILDTEIDNLKKLLPDRPLLAVDFVIPKEENKMYAIDLNISPGLTWTGIEDILDAKEIVDTIKHYINKWRE